MQYSMERSGATVIGQIYGANDTSDEDENMLVIITDLSDSNDNENDDFQDDDGHSNCDYGQQDEAASIGHIEGAGGMSNHDDDQNAADFQDSDIDGSQTADDIDEENEVITVESESESDNNGQGIDNKSSYREDFIKNQMLEADVKNLQERRKHLKLELGLGSKQHSNRESEQAKGENKSLKHVKLEMKQNLRKYKVVHRNLKAEFRELKTLNESLEQRHPEIRELMLQYKRKCDERNSEFKQLLNLNKNLKLKYRVSKIGG